MVFHEDQIDADNAVSSGCPPLDIIVKYIQLNMHIIFVLCFSALCYIISS